MINKSIRILPAFLIITILLSACDKKRISYVDMVKKEDKEIQNFINNNQIRIGSQPEEGTPSPEKEFFIPVEGVWMRIIDWGNTNNKAISKKTRVLTRMKVIRFTKKDDLKKPIDCFSANEAAGKMPPCFLYDASNKNISQLSDSPASNFSQLLTPAMQYALNIVGNHSIVEMIVSFKKGPLAQSIRSNGEPLYYERVSFDFEK